MASLSMMGDMQQVPHLPLQLPPVEGDDIHTLAEVFAICTSSDEVGKVEHGHPAIVTHHHHHPTQRSAMFSTTPTQFQQQFSPAPPPSGDGYISPEKLRLMEETLEELGLHIPDPEPSHELRHSEDSSRFGQQQQQQVVLPPPPVATMVMAAASTPTPTTPMSANTPMSTTTCTPPAFGSNAAGGGGFQQAFKMELQHQEVQRRQQHQQQQQRVRPASWHGGMVGAILEHSPATATTNHRHTMYAGAQTPTMVATTSAHAFGFDDLAFAATNATNAAHAHAHIHGNVRGNGGGRMSDPWGGSSSLSLAALQLQMQQQQQQVPHTQQQQQQQQHHHHHQQHHQQQQHQHVVAAAAVSPAAAAENVWWTEDMLDLTTAELKTMLATMPGLGPGLIDQLKVARRKKRNRMYARRSRQRRQSGSSDHTARVQYSQKIGALKTSNTALRSSLDTSRRSSSDSSPMSGSY